MTSAASPLLSIVQSIQVCESWIPWPRWHPMASSEAYTGLLLCAPLSAGEWLAGRARRRGPHAPEHRAVIPRCST